MSKRVESQPEQHDEGAAGRPASGILWPPPGLERLQGDLTRVAARAALSGGILVLPLLFVVARELEFATLGPFADAWWVTVVLAVVGLTFAVDALYRAVRLLRRGSDALAQGYDLSIVVQVAADSARDTGFLLTGERHFSVIDAREREAIGAIRIFSRVMYAAAGIWLPNAFALGLLLAARGLVSPAGLWMATLLPAAAMYVFGAVGGAVEESRVRRAREKWHRQPWAQDVAPGQAEAWRSSLAELAGVPSAPHAHPGLARVLRRSALLFVALAALVALPILTLIPTSAVGPVLATLAVPGFQGVRERAARAEGLRSYIVPTDPDVSPSEAGRILHVLLYVGSERDTPTGMREPAERIDVPWVPPNDAPNPLGIDLFTWADSLMPAVGRELTSEQRAYLGGLAGHPARGHFTRLAGAGRIDVAAARYEDPLPDAISLATMPLPPLSGLRAGAYTHLGAAAWELANGRSQGAERMVAEVLSVGFLLGDRGPTLLDNAIGYALVEAGGQALATLFEATGQAERAAELERLRAAADRAAARSGFDVPAGAEAWVRSLPTMVTDSTLARGLRWEYFVGIATLTPCLNLHRMVFGPDQEYRDFVASARLSLVDWPSEEGLFDLASGGWFGTSSSETTFLGRVLGVSMRGGGGTCREIVESLETAQALF